VKRIVDITASFSGLLIAGPLLIPVMVLVWLQDFKSPFYIAPRVGKDGKEFNMIKLRSMVVSKDNSGADSTSSNDSRITSIGRFIRKCKLDELTQLWNVFAGSMSLVGPRPNVKNETDLYTNVEKELLSVKPGITDFASIIFSDEGEILVGKKYPDLAYNQLIRPWKSRLGLIYIEKQSLILDIQLIFCTILAILSKKNTLTWIAKKLHKLDVEEAVITIAKRQVELYPFPPPGTEEIVTQR